jgi:hypothetical protein
MRTSSLLVALLLTFGATGNTSAQTLPGDKPQEPPPQPPTAKAEERSTGLPSPIKWTFNFDAGWGTFGFANSLFLDPKDPGTNENLSDQWFEGYVKPGLSAVYTLKSSSELYGKISAVGERTYGEVPTYYGSDVSSFGPEDLYVGWRSGKSLSIGENAVDLSVGRERFRLGHGFLLFDGASEGGSRGGYWTNARQAFQFAAVARFQPTHHKVEAFYLDKDELPDNDSGTRLSGLNYEFAAGKDNSTTLGATYLHFNAHADMKPGRDGLHVFNARAYTAPFPAAPDLSFEFEYAAERNGDVLNSNAWTAQGSYQFSKAGWKPKFTYRYAFFEGDDPATPVNEGWDTLLLGFYDWGYWWQGEIAGEYFLSNSNLRSQLVRAHFTPNDKVSGGLLFFDFRADKPQAFGPEVTAKDVAFEIDAYTDWKLNANFTLSLVGAFADPGKAVQQYTGRTKNFTYGMAYIAYSF